MSIPLASLAIAGGFITLMWGADRFVIGAAGTAKHLGVSPMLIGLTVVSIGTSAPELLVSAMAAMDARAGLSVGNVVGSNIANVGLVVGASILVSPLLIAHDVLRREVPMLMLAMCLALGVLLDGELSRLDGVLLLVGLVLMLGYMIRQATNDREEGIEVEVEEIPENISMGGAILWLMVGMAVLIGSARLLVAGAIDLALAFGVSDVIIGLTIVAIGTSLPELAASVMAAYKQEHELVVGNVIGSNMFNLLAVLPVPALIAPGPFEEHVLSRDIPMMFGVSVLLIALALFRGKKEIRISRLEGGLLLVAYVSYLGLLIYQATN